jgi:hypothetical protein
MPTTEKTKPALTINQLTDQERGICNEALHLGSKQLHRMVDDLKVLPASFSQPEAVLLLTVLSELPPETQALVKSLMDQLRAAGLPVAKSGTVIHFPPP